MKTNKNKPLHRQMEKVIENVYTLIEIRDINVSDVEKAIGVSIGYLSRIKKGMNMDALNLINLACYFNVTIDDLVFKDYKNELIKAKIAKLEEEYMIRKHKLEEEFEEACKAKRKEVLEALAVND